jgi:hypothetical protein
MMHNDSGLCGAAANAGVKMDDNNVRPIFMAKINNSKFEFSPAPKWEKDDKIYKKATRTEY